MALWNAAKCITVYLCAFLVHQSSSCGIVNGVLDLSKLKGVWPVVGAEKSNSRYEISLCSPLSYDSSVQKEKCTNSAVCFFSSDSAISLGNFTNDMSKLRVLDSPANDGFELYLHSSSSCSIGDQKGRSAILFTCGPNLGSPELTAYGQCQANFFWKTSAACKTPVPREEVPCYVINSKGKKIDLTYMIKAKGGYTIATSSPDTKFVINVCSIIVPDDLTKNCPGNTAACRIIGDKAVSFGTLVDRLQETKGELSLTYESNAVVQGCSSKPKTRILFLCPSRLKSRPPYVLSDKNCQYEIVWETEYACPEQMLIGDLKSCQFNEDDHGVHIDLSPLRKETGQYHISGKENGKRRDFYLNICGGLNNMTCNKTSWKSVSACEVDISNNRSQIIGIKLHSQLKYADGQLFLTYGSGKGGECTSGLDVTTVIQFICSDVEGEPVYVPSEPDQCMNFFQWKTKHACVTSSDTSCSTKSGSRTIELGRLKKTKGSPWHVIDESESPSKGKVLYLLNVCGDIFSLQSDSKCEPGAAICSIDESGKYRNLGRFESPPIFDPALKTVSLQYTNGDPCKGTKFWKSSIQFVCKLGQVMHEPVLVNINEDECVYEFEWRTAEACPLGWLSGTGCRIYSADLDINFDLTPLKSSVYKVETDSHIFHIGVCGSASNTPCTNPPDQNVGICQESKKTGNFPKVIGESNDKLSYFNGYIQLDYNSQKGEEDNATIYFFCEPNVEVGSPQFIEKIDHKFVFHWHTKLVCEHTSATDCVVHDNKSQQLYDLTSLSRSSKNWALYADDDDDKKQKKLYINVCRPLIQQPYCDSSASSCAVLLENGNETLAIPNLGRAGNVPELSSEGHLQLNYSNGSPCTAYGAKTTYSTIIHFLCKKGVAEDGPVFLGVIGNCIYSFLWTTNAACPITEALVIDKCQLTDPDTDFTFDLSSLKKDSAPYVVKTADQTFEMNICGPVKGGCSNSEHPESSISVCAKSSKDKQFLVLGNAESYSLSYSEEKELTLTYKKKVSSPSEKGTQVIIRFPCSTDIIEAEPKFLKREGSNYIFSMATALSCQTKSVCNFMDKKGNEYDLTSLSKTNGFNWVAFDTRPGQEQQRYFLNFCMPLNRVATYNCPGGGTAACQVTVGGTTGFSLGSLPSAPEISEDGVITLHYTGGSPCGQMKYRSAIINLFCSAKQGVLTFVGETPECEYLFSMDTPAACPLHTSLGNDCVVTEPMYGYTFDLNPLRTIVHNVTHGEYSFLVTVCNNLSGRTDDCKYAGVCQTKPSDVRFSKSLGIPNSTLMYQKGVITMRYWNGTSGCHGQYNRSSLITFTCDQDATPSRSGNLTFISEEDDCTYLFEYPTVYACPPFNTIECTTEDDQGNLYDLSDLSLTHDNYYVKDPIHEGNMFVINVCRSIVHKGDSLCPYTSAVCLINSSSSDASKRTKSIGHPESGPFIAKDTGKVRLKYLSGEPCPSSLSSSARFYETIIDFTCDHHKLHSSPEYVGKDDCAYYFDWFTIYACPVKEVASVNDCSVSDPLTGFVFNLSSLRNAESYNVVVDKHVYSLNVCGAAKGSSCGNDAGMCQEEKTESSSRHWNAGKPNGNLMLREKVLFLNYSGGDTCHGSYQRNTIIEFRCGNGIGAPEFLHETSNCTYFFVWYTELACHELIHCAVVYKGETIEMASLAESHHLGTSALKGDHSSYYVSVCGPLGVIPGTSCPPQSSICKVDESQSGLSLGVSAFPPFVDFQGHPTVLFINGSVCQSDTSMIYRSRIIFLCDPTELPGAPILSEVTENGCVYVFEWKTSIVCHSSKKVTPPKECLYKDVGRGLYFDLSTLRKNGSYYDVNISKNESYILNVCDTVSSSKLSPCTSSGVCYQKTVYNVSSTVHNFGLTSTQRLSYDSQRLRLALTDGDDCPSGNSGKRSSEILFTCNPNAGRGKPTLYKQYSCLVVFSWETNLVCRNYDHPCTFDLDGSQYDLYQLSSLSHNWNITDSNHNTYWMNLCRGIQQNEETSGCPPTAAVCMRDSRGSHMPLGMVYTMKAKKTNNSGFFLTYDSQSNLPCASLKSSKDMNATTRIFMACGRSSGPPVFISGPDRQCFYDFMWESNLACPDSVDEVILEKNGVLYDKRMDFGMNISDILNKTFNVSGSSKADNYSYLINLSGVSPIEPSAHCHMAAVCQTKPSLLDKFSFSRDVGSFSTRKFYLKGGEVHLTLTSLMKGCGKNKDRNVTSVISLQCSTAAGIGKPQFLYESSGCDYMFYWATNAVCPDKSRQVKVNSTTDAITDPDAHVQRHSVESTSHRVPLVLSLVFGLFVGFVAIFIVSKKERRLSVASKFNGCFKRVTVPRFRYKRCDNEKIILVDSKEPKNIYTANDDDDNLLL